MTKEEFEDIAIGDADLLSEEAYAFPDDEEAKSLLARANALDDAVDIIEGIEDVGEADAVASVLFDAYLKGGEMFLVKVSFFKKLYLH